MYVFLLSRLSLSKNKESENQLHDTINIRNLETRNFR
jgi:hypothetical protein